MKKILIGFLCVIMIIVMTPTVVFAATTVDSVKITGLPTMHEGDYFRDLNVSYDAPQGCSVRTIWQVFDDTEGYRDVWNEEKYEKDKVYHLYACVEPEAGYAFSEDFQILDNLDVAYDDIWGNNYDEDDIIDSYWVDLGRFTLAEYIEKVEVETSDIVDGETFSVKSIKCFDKNDTEIHNAVDSDVVLTSVFDNYEDVTVVEDGKYYQLNVILNAKEGYVFRDDPQEPTEIYINGEQADGIDFNEPKKSETWRDYSLLKPLKKLEFKGVPEVKGGKKISRDIDLVSPFLEDEDNIYIDWYEKDSTRPVSYTEFEAGKTYHLYILVNTYYEKFDEDFVFVVDGKTYKPQALMEDVAAVFIEYKAAEAETIVTDPPKDNEPSKKDVPKTADPTESALPALLLIMSAAGMIYIYKKKNCN